MAASVRSRLTTLAHAQGEETEYVLMRYALATPSVSAELRALLTTGFCGGYTTFSTYSYETATLLEDGQYGRAGTYALASVVLALVATFAGFVLARELIALRERM